MEKVPFKSIMVCEDDDAFRKRLARSLRDRGLTVFEATSAEEGLSVAEEFNPEAAVMDIRMAGRGGLWGIEQLLLKFPSVKVVVLTGFGTITTAIDAVKLGAINYLTKPVSVDILLSAFISDIAKDRVKPDLPSLEDVQQEYINRVLAEFSGNVSQAAKALGMHRRSLQRILKAKIV